jgi:hypothetical protein
MGSLLVFGAVVGRFALDHLGCAVFGVVIPLALGFPVRHDCS